MPDSSLVLPCLIDVDGTRYAVRAHGRGIEVLIADRWHLQDAVVIHNEEDLRRVVRAFAETFGQPT